MIKKILSAVEEKQRKKEYGKGTIICKSDKELDEAFDKFNSQLSSPGGAAEKLGVSRAYIHMLEKSGKIRAYRLVKEDVNWDKYPLWMKLSTSPTDEFIYIPDEDIEKVRKEMIAKAENKLKRLKGK